MDAVCIARLCGASSRSRATQADLVRAAAWEQHGADACYSLASLRRLEETPDTYSVNLRKAGGRAVVRGAEIESTAVGGCFCFMCQTRSQIPPAPGDAFCLPVRLRAGLYTVSLHGWRNPHHGILDLWLDGERLTSLDWCGARTEKHRYQLQASVPHTGEHTLYCCTERSSADQCLRARYWMCLSRVSFVKER